MSKRKFSHQEVRGYIKRYGASYELETTGYQITLIVDAPWGYQWGLNGTHCLVESINKGDWGTADLWQAMGERLVDEVIEKCNAENCEVWNSEHNICGIVDKEE